MSQEEHLLWKDPFSEDERGAVLLSDQIHYFASKKILIWESYDAENLRPAAYDVRVGDEYYQDDKRFKLLPEKHLAIPPHGLVYIKTKETFRIPYYLIGRYSIRVTQVYRGMMIDNGLHVDPGYRGHIFVPVHNFTTQKRILKHGEKFLSIEFSRTTPLPAALTEVESEEELYRVVGEDENHMKTVLFYETVQNFKCNSSKSADPYRFWDKYPSETHMSATLELEKRARELESTTEERLRVTEGAISQLKKFGFIGVVALIVALLAIILPVFYEINVDHQKQLAELSAKIESLARAASGVNAENQVRGQSLQVSPSGQNAETPLVPSQP